MPKTTQEIYQLFMMNKSAQNNNKKNVWYSAEEVKKLLEGEQ